MSDPTNERTAHVALIASAYLGNPSNGVELDQVAKVIQTIHAAVVRLDEKEAPPVQQTPAVPPHKSIHQDYIVCLEDGKKLKMLKRYLRSHFNMTPEEYRRKWGLRPDYPMVAPAYAERRSKFAKESGLGTKTRRAAQA